MQKLVSLLMLLCLSCSAVGATSITTPYIFTANTLIQSAQVNSNFSTIASVVNSNIDNGNIAAAANINPSKLNLTVSYLNLVGAGVLGFGVGQSGDTKPRGAIYADGSLQLGPGGATATDIGFTRSAANTLQLNIPNGGGVPKLDINNGNLLNINAATIATLTLTNPLTVANGGSGLATLTVGAVQVGNGTSTPTQLGPSATVGQAVVSNGAGVPPVYAFATGFGDSSNLRAAPPTGILTGEYRTSANWTTTGPITCNHCRLYFGGTVTINNNITVGNGTEWNRGGLSNPVTSVSGNCQPGQGPGGGVATFGTSATVDSGGGGGSHGAAGGANVVNSVTGQVAPIYQLGGPLQGSGGAGGTFATTSGGNGGNGADGFYMEAVGNVSIAANITATGAAGTNSGAGANDCGGGGGSGGGIDIRCLGNVTISGGNTVSANGGAGGTGQYMGGSGGGGGVINIQCLGTYTNSGTVQCLGGAYGTGVSTNGIAGTAGTVGNGAITTFGGATAAVAPRMTP